MADPQKRAPAQRDRVVIKLASRTYHASAAELRAIDRGLRDADAGRFASETEVEATFAKYRK